MEVVLLEDAGAPSCSCRICPPFLLKEFVDARHLQHHIFDPIDEIRPPVLDVSAHLLQRDEALLAAQRDDIHLLLDCISPRRKVGMDGVAPLLHASLGTVAAAGKFLSEACLHQEQFFEHLAVAVFRILHRGGARKPWTVTDRIQHV